VGFQEQAHPPVLEGQHVQHVFPWVPAIDDWAVLLRVLLGFPTPLWIIVRMANGTTATETMARLQAVISASEQFLSHAPADQTTLTQQAVALRDLSLGRHLQLNNGALRGRVLLMAPGRADEVVAGVLGQSLSGDATLNTPSRLLLSRSTLNLGRLRRRPALSDYRWCSQMKLLASPSRGTVQFRLPVCLP
jgi:hypothetical protein